jgi:hypothetical protein
MKLCPKDYGRKFTGKMNFGNSFKESYLIFEVEASVKRFNIS